MNWRSLLEAVRDGKVSVEDALSQLKDLRSYLDIGHSKLDIHRSLRQGIPEVIFCPGKTPNQVVEAVGKLQEHESLVIATRAEPEHVQAIQRHFPKAVYHKAARVVSLGEPRKTQGGQILVLTAGTSDLPVAEEAAVTAELLGNAVVKEFDVGAAGVHRLLDQTEELLNANVLIIVAGMDGVLPTLVAGLVDKPVIAVPTSRGYGASFQGLAALLTMLNSCVPGVAVVNIDNGFGAGVLASRINHMNL
ncbi:MAG: 1-(5-phosphoribosyl)-5-amino-4-imidazole-carboxylate carboxylase [Candidatus Fraserbacteria bacterium RBG_16_55_9]|uniref:1-(5-phosphoribosyl)-5-amino-4-imidazole-carboxylate carboxylase n=1 Tax=Fraserbacteria sp. (strain RBG_16_55_9) TaxID=1817864 RepID=A0A1F5UVN6_FRAXR|nr:MAG: 1-(5-phosphoribosyl)-5-amino-4-imidazole-carboxylate carboxylase [Candidatus Fraserbacteria bacterium RBG_16_55_9]